jgi:hypothetical protein
LLSEADTPVSVLAAPLRAEVVGAPSAPVAPLTAVVRPPRMDDVADGTVRVSNPSSVRDRRLGTALRVRPVSRLSRV